MPDEPLPANQEDREVYLRDIKAGQVADILKAGGVVEIEPDSTWMAEDLYVAIGYARAEEATVIITMEPPDPIAPHR